MTNSSATFSFEKRSFLHNKLDDLLNSWARKSGHGTFFLSVTDGVPNFQFGLQFDLSDPVSASEPRHQPVQQHHQKQQVSQRSLHGKKARNRARAVRYQAAKAAESAAKAASDKAFPGQGKIVGAAPKPVLPLPLKKGDVFPPSPIPSATTPLVSSPPPSTSTSSKAPIFTNSHPTTIAFPVKVRDAVISDDSDDESEQEEFYSCGQCEADIDSNSPSYYCPLCVKCYHVQCIAGHKCKSFM